MQILEHDNQYIFLKFFFKTLKPQHKNVPEQQKV